MTKVNSNSECHFWSYHVPISDQYIINSLMFYINQELIEYSAAELE